MRQDADYPVQKLAAVDIKYHTIAGTNKAGTAVDPESRNDFAVSHGRAHTTAPRHGGHHIGSDMGYSRFIHDFYDRRVTAKHAPPVMGFPAIHLPQARAAVSKIFSLLIRGLTYFFFFFLFILFFPFARVRAFRARVLKK
jgi:hypothetical protein